MTLQEEELLGEPSKKRFFEKGMIIDESQAFCKENVRKVQSNQKKR